jgi:hypothetical protein
MTGTKILETIDKAKPNRENACIRELNLSVVKFKMVVANKIWRDVLYRSGVTEVMCFKLYIA